MAFKRRGDFLDQRQDVAGLVQQGDNDREGRLIRHGARLAETEFSLI
jgi:hypothetical protein